MILGGCLTCLSCWSAGKILLGRLRIELLPWEVQPFRFVAGSACTSILVFLLLAAGEAKTFTLVALGIVSIAAACRVKVLPSKVEPFLAIPRFAKWLLGGALCLYVLFYLVNALAPETSPDGTTYHLALVRQYLSQRGFGRITTNMFANFPEGLEMLFLMAFSVGRHSAATLVEFAFLLALPLLMAAYGRRFGYGQAGLAAAVWIFVSPVFAIDGTSAYNDVAGTCVAFCTFYLLRIWEEERKPALLILIGLLAGFAYGIKYPLFLAVPYAAAVVSWKLRNRPREAARAAAIVIGCAAVMFLPWMVKNWYTVDNPFSPFLNRFFPNPYVTVWFENSYLASLSEGARSFSRLFDSAVRGAYTAGLLGPIFLLTPLGLVALRWAEGRKLLLAAAVFGWSALSNKDTRFLMPLAPFAALAIALVMSRIRSAIPTLIAASLILSWPPVLNRYCHPGSWRLATWPVADALRLQPEAEILQRRLGEQYDLLRLVEEKVPKNSRVLSFGGNPPLSYVKRDVIIFYESEYAQRVWHTLWNPVMRSWQATGRIKFSFAGHSVRRLRILQTAIGSDVWSIAEFRVLHNNEELRRSGDWRIGAKPNPWDVGLAFDGSPVTRWTTDEAIRPGMWVSVDLGRLQTVDAVVLNCSHDQSQIRLILQEETEPAVWKTIADRPEIFDEPMQWSLRRAATDMVKTMGITHLLVRNGETGARDFERQTARWGMSFLGEAGGCRLYSLGR